MVCVVLVSEEGVEGEDEVVLVRREVTSLQVGAKVIDPSQPAALPTSSQPCIHHPLNYSLISLSPSPDPSPTLNWVQHVLSGF